MATPASKPATVTADELREDLPHVLAILDPLAETVGADKPIGEVIETLRSALGNSLILSLVLGAIEPKIVTSPVTSRR